MSESSTIYRLKENGTGFEPKHAEKIVDTFTRVAGSPYKGTGIGLAVVKKAIEKHHGRIWG